MSNDEMIWDAAAGKLVPKAGFRKEPDQPAAAEDRVRQPTRKMKSRSEGAQPNNVAVESEPVAARPEESSAQRDATPTPRRRDAKPVRDDELTVAHGAADTEEEATAGWLAFLSGTPKGGFSVVRIGQNAIGRGHDNHIIIEGERSVSRVAAAFIIVDPSDLSAHLRPGLGSSIVRVNGELIATSHVLAVDDHIQIGDVSCAFVPFPSPVVPSDGD